MCDTTRFFDAVMTGNSALACDLLAAELALAQARDAGGATALHHAAFRGDRALVDLLCDAGAEVNARDGQHDATPAGWAVHSLRERGGLLAVEIEDALFAVRARDVVWVRRLVARHPALVHAADVRGKPLAAHARESGDAAVAAVFAEAVGAERDA